MDTTDGFQESLPLILTERYSEEKGRRYSVSFETVALTNQATVFSFYFSCENKLGFKDANSSLIYIYTSNSTGGGEASFN